MPAVKRISSAVWMMFPRRVAAVSYLNTIPFIYGIEHAGLLRAQLLLSPPAGNVEHFVSHKADIALVPAGAIPSIPEANIITKYCIGASRPVRTVVLVSDTPVEMTRRIWLDSHSRTSSLLVRILCRELWKVDPQLLYLDDYSVVDSPQDGDAFLLIGDKVFSHEGRFKYSYDLAECWNGLTGLPFVFALWISRGSVPQEEIGALEQSLAFGLDHIPEAIDTYGHTGKPYAYDYLTQNIDFILDEPKLKALTLYWEKAALLDPRATPG